MSEDFSSKYVADGTDREDRANVPTDIFDTVRLEIKQPDTAVLLLKCQEKSILASAAAALSKFGEKDAKNLEKLFDLQVVENIIPLTEHEDIFTRRFAMKLMAQMSSIDNVRNFLLETDWYVPRLAHQLAEDSDVFMQEFSSRILAELGKDLFGVNQLIDVLDVDLLFRLMTSTDPDVKRNCIEIVYNMLADPFVRDRIVPNEGFNVMTIYGLLEEPYRIIQELALGVLERLVEVGNDIVIFDKIRTSGGLDRLFNLLDIEEWQDLHPKVLQIIALMSENKRTAEWILASGEMQKLFDYVREVDVRKLESESLQVMVAVANTKNGIKMLRDYEFVDHLLGKLQDEDQRHNYQTICDAISRMSVCCIAARDFIEKNAVPLLMDITRNESLDWNTRKSAFYALKQLISFDMKISDGIPGFKLLLLQNIAEAPLEMKILSVELTDSLLQYSQDRDDPITDYVDILCSTFDRVDQSADQLKILSCQTLSNICQRSNSHTEENADENTIFNAMKRHADKLFDLIHSDDDSLPVKQEAVKLLMHLCENKSLGEEFVKSGCLIYMIQNRSAARVIPSWDSCISMLLNCHLPSKFAYSGRLTFHDVTNSGFYAMRRATCPFPDLEEFYKLKMCPVQAIYVVNFNETNVENNSVFGNSEEVDKARQALRRESLTKGIRLSSEDLESLLELRYGQMELDPALCEYVREIKRLISIAEAEDFQMNFDTCDLVNIARIESRAAVIAEFVIRTMSPEEPSTENIDCLAKQHLQEIKIRIKRNVIPLGQIKVGSYFERALLYKVLADQILLPAVLARDQWGKAWIEVSVPQIDDSNPNLPRTLLRANYIVDLMTYPGELLPINGRRAKEYLERDRC